jgi:hypothetical protein
MKSKFLTLLAIAIVFASCSDDDEPTRVPVVVDINDTDSNISGNLTYDLVLDEIVDGKIENMLTKKGATKFVSGSKLGSKDVSVYKERTDIPVEIRELMGEYKDPALNYAKTVLKLSSLAANHNFLNLVESELA